MLHVLPGDVVSGLRLIARRVLLRQELKEPLRAHPTWGLFLRVFFSRLVVRLEVVVRFIVVMVVELVVVHFGDTVMGFVDVVEIDVEVVTPATFQEQTPDIFEEEHIPHTFQQHTPNTSDQQHTHSPPVTSQSPSPHATTSQPPQTQSNLQRPTHEKKQNPKYFNEKYVNTAIQSPTRGKRLPSEPVPRRDYFETFSPVSKPVTIWIILCLALSKNWPLCQLDVNNAFLHGTLHEDVFMIQPPGYIHPQFPNHISDASLFLYDLNGITAYFLIYVNDIVLLLNDGSHTVDSSSYRSIVGSLQYLAITRPDVSFAVNKLSQFMHAPTQLHLQALKRVLRYLKGTIHHGLFLNRKSAITLTAFSDSNWGSVKDNGRSTTAYILYLGSNIISWRSAPQKSVSRSSTEAEYKALANASAEMMWVQNLLHE
ncbi:retrovirus-related pol polyprotein from transposon RE1, partial [Tanacetum coccineum]